MASLQNTLFTLKMIGKTFDEQISRKEIYREILVHQTYNWLNHHGFQDSINKIVDLTRPGIKESINEIYDAANLNIKKYEDHLEPVFQILIKKRNVKKTFVRPWIVVELNDDMILLDRFKKARFVKLKYTNEEFVQFCRDIIAHINKLFPVDESKLELKAIALLHIYQRKIIDPTNMNMIAHHYGWKSGRKLKQDYTDLQFTINRTGTGSLKSMTTRLAYIEKIIPLLAVDKSAQQRAIEEAKTLKRKIADS